MALPVKIIYALVVLVAIWEFIEVLSRFLRCG